jgi:hypothetical protein
LIDPFKSESAILKIASTVLLSQSMPIFLNAVYISDLDIVPEPSLSTILKALLTDIFADFIALKNKYIDF